MNKQELIENLNSLGVNPSNYTIDSYYKDSSWVLEQSTNHVNNLEYGVWNVFQIERGKRYAEVSFYSESEACLYIYEKLKSWHEKTKNFIKK